MAERINKDDLEVGDLVFVSYDSKYVDVKDDREKAIASIYGRNGNTLTYYGVIKKFYKDYGYVDVLKFYVDSDIIQKRPIKCIILPRGLTSDLEHESRFKEKRYYEMIKVENLEEEDMFHWELAGKNSTIGNRR